MINKKQLKNIILQIILEQQNINKQINTVGQLREVLSKIIQYSKNQQLASAGKSVGSIAIKGLLKGLAGVIPMGGTVSAVVDTASQLKNNLTDGYKLSK